TSPDSVLAAQCARALQKWLLTSCWWRYESIETRSGHVRGALFDLTEQIGHLSARMEDYLKILESAGASVVPEGLETDDLDLGDMANLVNY
ncbi:hypothetical protein CI238_13505, partial [Colletotrichum incanum]